MTSSKDMSADFLSIFILVFPHVVNLYFSHFTSMFAFFQMDEDTQDTKKPTANTCKHATINDNL